jgi:hypothetical protein
MKEERKAVLSFELAKQMYEGSDEPLRQLALDTYPELGKISSEEKFLEMLNGCTVEISDTCVTFNKPEGWMFQYNKKNGYFWCQYDRVWSVFRYEYGHNWQKFSELCVSMVDEHLNWKGVTPGPSVT